MKKLTLLSLLTVLVLAACEEDKETHPQPISVTNVNSELNILNNSNTDLYFTVFPEEWIPLVDWVQVISDEKRLLPSELIKIPLDKTTEHFGQIPSSEPLVFYYWEAVDTDGTLTPGPLSHFIFNP